MSASPRRETALDIATGNLPRGVRRETRREELRQVDYSPFPRVSLGAVKQIGLLVNESDSGLCIVSSTREDVGTLLRVMVRGLHGNMSRDVVARVVWCREGTEGRCRLGLEMLRESQPQMLKVRNVGGRRARTR